MSSAVTGTRDRSVLPGNRVGNPDAVSWNARMYLLWMFAILALRKRERIAELPVQEFLRRCGAPSPSRCASPGSTHHRTARSPGSFDHPGRRYGHHRPQPHGGEQRWPTHHGTDALTFELECSEEFGLSYKTLRDFAFTETGGEVCKAQRMDQPSNIRWRVTVEPDANRDVTVVLPVTQDCAAERAVCTGGGGKLSNRLEFTVSGPGG